MSYGNLRPRYHCDGERLRAHGWRSDGYEYEGLWKISAALLRGRTLGGWSPGHGASHVRLSEDGARALVAWTGGTTGKAGSFSGDTLEAATVWRTKCSWFDAETAADLALVESGYDGPAPRAPTE